MNLSSVKYNVIAFQVHLKMFSNAQAISPHRSGNDIYYKEGVCILNL